MFNVKQDSFIKIKKVPHKTLRNGTINIFINDYYNDRFTLVMIFIYT